MSKTIDIIRSKFCIKIRDSCCIQLVTYGNIYVDRHRVLGVEGQLFVDRPSLGLIVCPRHPLYKSWVHNNSRLNWIIEHKTINDIFAGNPFIDKAVDLDASIARLDDLPGNQHTAGY